MIALASTIHACMRVVNACEKSYMLMYYIHVMHYVCTLYVCHVCMIVHFAHCSLIRFPPHNRIFWGRTNVCGEEGLTVHIF